MVSYTVELTDAEHKALAAVAVNPQAWIENMVKNRCRIAMEEIVRAEVDRKLAAGETISGTKESLLLEADVKTAAEVQAELDIAPPLAQQ